MFKRFLINIILSSSVYASAVAAATVELAVPANIHVLSIDGQEQPSTFFGTRDHVKQLSVGEHVLSVRYTQLFDINAEDHDIVKSAPMAIRFIAQEGERYQLVVNPPKRYEAALKFAKNPDIQLLNQTTGQSQAAVVIKSYAEASLVDTLSKAFNNSEVSPNPTNSRLSTNNTQLLQDIWLRATPQERQAFAAWLASQAAGK